MALLHPNGREISRQEVARARASANAGEGRRGHAYQGADTNGVWTANWPARLQSADRDWLPARNMSVARARDLINNELGGRSIVSRRRNAAIGRGWRRSSRPSARALGMTQQEARDLGQAIEVEWDLYAYGHSFSCDAERRFTFGQLLRIAATHLMQDGEFLAVVEWAEGESTKYKTRLRLVDPDRLCNPRGVPDNGSVRPGFKIRGGVEYDQNDIPVAYWIREQHPSDVGLQVAMSEPQRWDRFAHALGRPQVLHGFDPERAGQSRGVSAFAAALKGFRALSRFQDATLQSAVINALVVGFMQSSAGPEAVSESFSAEDLATFDGDREAFYKQNPVKIGEAILPVLPLGDELKLATASKDVGQFDAFFRSIYRLICATLGVTYEEGSMDYSSTNYSSARAAMIPAWKETEAFIGTIDAMLATPFHAAWLEEAFEEGHVRPANDNAPSWYEAQEAYAKGRWIGPGRGYIDQTKEVAAAAGRLEAGISTLEDECADQGKDWVEVLDQREYELAEIANRPHLAAAMAQGFNPLTGQAQPAPAQTGDGQVAPEDARPAARSALSALHAMADSPAHEAFLDARPAA